MAKRWSVRTYLSLLALAVAVPCAALLVYAVTNEARREKRQLEATTLSLAQLVAAQARQFLNEAEIVAVKLSQRPLVRAVDAQQRDPVFDQFLDLHPQFANLILCDADGRVLQSASKAPEDIPMENLRAQWSDAVVRNGRFTVGKPIIGQLTRRWVCVLGQPVKNAEGNLVGVLGMSVDLGRFHTVASPIHLPAHSTLTIINQEGTVIIRSPEAQHWIGKTVQTAEITKSILNRQEGNVIARDIDQERRICGFATIAGVGWRVYAGIPNSFALVGTRLKTVKTSLISGALLGLVIALVLFLARFINEPIRMLFNATVAAAEGRSEKAVPVTGPKEIAAVAAQFNRMLASRQQKEAEIQKLTSELEKRVTERTAELEQANKELQREVSVRKSAEEALSCHRMELQGYIDSMSTMNAKVAPDGTLLLVNRITQEATGLPLETLMRTNFLEGHWWAFDPAVQHRVRAAFAEACAGRSVSYDERVLVFGKVIDIHFSLIPASGRDGQVSYIVAEARDITQRKQAEEALAERTGQLEATNKELEAFAYSVSHDLRAPLRAIDGFTKALFDDYQSRLDEEGISYLHRVRTATNRMSHLIDDLLHLSRISRSELQWATVDLSALAAEIVSNVKESNPGRAVDLILRPGMLTRGDPRLLRVVVENLLRNSWKFTRDKNPARIEFGMRPISGVNTFFVDDNGAGFDMTYAGKLFGAFQRLHSSDEYEGTGIGLATVQRIVHRHGGRVWAEGRIDQGATFFFTLSV